MLGKIYLCSRVSPVLLLFPSFWQKRLHEAAEECDEVDEDGWLLKVIPERIEHIFILQYQACQQPDYLGS